MKQSTLIILLLVLILVVSIGILIEAIGYQETISIIEVPAQRIISNG